MLKAIGGSFFLALLSIRQCSEGKGSANQKKGSSDTLYISIARTGCYGRCPIDKVELLPDGTVRYEGQRFVSRVGVYIRHLTDKEIVKARQLLLEGRFDTYQEVYDNPHVSDLPSLILTYQADKKSKRIVCRMQCPPELPDKIEKLRTFLAEEGDFQMIQGPDADSTNPHAD
ncbi:MAG: DUF6438 domain-containing protein [Bacteroidia bacterium]|nr:DUF6438 domain-containing protein [Bacteroidia bacterium]MDW8416706.1 DUF6438 domain-containing protein [Bacteroidia bacterium]